MFNDIGSKIMKAGKIMFWIGMALSIFVGIAAVMSIAAEGGMVGLGVILGLVIAAVYGFIIYFSVLSYLALGKITECQEQLLELAKKEREDMVE